MKRKILSILLVVLMMFALLIPSLAYDINITNPAEDSAYVGYRLLSLVLTGNPDAPYRYEVLPEFKGLLRDVIEYFDSSYFISLPFNVQEEDAIIGYIYELEKLGAAEKRKFAEKILDLIGGSSYTMTPFQYNGDTATIYSAESGYWLIYDENDTNRENYFLILDTFDDQDNLDITIKRKLATIEKYVMTDNSGWGIVTDASTNENIQFALIATLPDNFSDEAFYQSLPYTYKIFDDNTHFIDYDNIQIYLIKNGSNFDLNLAPPLSGDNINIFDITNNFPSNNLSDIDIGQYFSKDFTTGEVTFHNAPHYPVITRDSIFVVSFTAKINDANLSQDDLTQPSENIASLEYGTYEDNNKNYDYITIDNTQSNKVLVHTFGLKIEKLDAHTGEPLEGVAFTLMRDNTEVYLIDNHDGTYTVDFEQTSGSPGFISPHDGIINIIGLDGNTIYTLEEIEPLEGYNALLDSLVFTIKALYDQVSGTITPDPTIDNIDFIYETGFAKVTVANRRGTELPSTGGIGTTILYIGGTVLLLGSVFGLAVYFMINSKRRSVRRK